MHTSMRGWLAAQQVSMELNVRSGGTSVLYCTHNFGVAVH